MIASLQINVVYHLAGVLETLSYCSVLTKKNQSFPYIFQFSDLMLYELMQSM